MRRFLFNIVIFSAIIILLLVIGEIVVRNLPSSYSTKHNELINQRSKINTLILGSSHSYYGLIPEVLGDSVFNLANISQSNEYDYALLKQYIDTLPNLKTIILPISYFTYRDPQLEDDPTEWRYVVKYKTRMKLPTHSDFSLYNLELYDFDGYTAQLSNFIFKRPSNMSSSSGFGLGYTLDNKNPAWKENILHRANMTTFENPGRFPEVLEVQKKILQLAQGKNIEVLLITTPVYKEYFENLDRNQENEMRAGIDTLKRKFNVKYFDFMRDNRFNDDDFFDSDHLSEIGARKFSQILRDSIN